MATAAIKPLLQWSEEQLWAMFMLVDGLHDFGDVGGTRSTQGAYNWFIRQPIPYLLRGTYRVPLREDEAPTIREYAEALFGIDLRPKTKVEPLLNNMLERALPKRMGKGTDARIDASPKDLVDFGLKESGIQYELPLSQLVAVARGTGGGGAAGGGVNYDVADRFIKICKALRHIRVNKDGFDDNTLTGGDNAGKRDGLARFFKKLVGGGDTYATNFDASPGFYKLFYDGTQQFTPLNALDSARASIKLSPGDVPATYVPINAPEWTYNTQLMSIGLFTIRIFSNAAMPSTSLRIEVTYEGTTYADTIENTFDPKSYVSGPTLGYIARMIEWVDSQRVPITSDALVRAIGANKGDQNIYTLQSFLVDILPAILPVANQKDHLCRFLSDWKGYGDAEQVRFMAEKLAEVPGGGAVADARGMPTKPFIGGTVDENSHQQMTLRGITHGYSHYKYYDFSIVPSGAPTAGQLMYARVSAVISRVSTILNFVSKLGGADASIDQLIANLGLAITGVAEDPLPMLVGNAEVRGKIERFKDPIRTLLIHKFKNARQFLSKAREMVGGAEDVKTSINTFAAPVFADERRFDGLAGLADDAAVNLFTINVTQLPEDTDVIRGARAAAGGSVPIGTFVAQIEEYLDAKQTIVNNCKTILPNLLGAGPRLKVPQGGNIDVPTPYIQTQVFGDTPPALKQNTTIAFYPGYLMSILVNLPPLFENFHSQDVVEKSMQRITKGLYDHLTSFYAPDAPADAPANTPTFKDRVDDVVGTFREQVMTACDNARIALNGITDRTQKTPTRIAQATVIKTAIITQFAAVTGFTEMLFTLDDAGEMEGGGQRGGAVVSFERSIAALIELSRGLAKIQVTEHAGVTYDLMKIMPPMPTRAELAARAAAAAPGMEVESGAPAAAVRQAAAEGSPVRGLRDVLSPSGSLAVTPEAAAARAAAARAAAEMAGMATVPTTQGGVGWDDSQIGGRRRTYRKTKGGRRKTYKKHL